MSDFSSSSDDKEVVAVSQVRNNSASQSQSPIQNNDCVTKSDSNSKSNESNSESEVCQDVPTNHELERSSHLSNNEQQTAQSFVSNASSSHSSMAQKIFAGKTQAGSTNLMCSNLRSNPFSLNTESSSNSNSSSILAKPRFTLKPSQFGSSSGDKNSFHASNSSTLPQPLSSNPFLRPAKLTYDNDEHEGGDSGSFNSKIRSTGASNSSTFSSDASGNSDSASQQRLGEQSYPPNEQSLSSDNEDTSGSSEKAASQGESLTGGTILSQSTDAVSQSNNASKSQASAFVFGEGIDDRVTNVAKENSNGHLEEPAKPKVKTLEEAADEYKKLQESGPSLPKVETKTGEEEESNVLQINCKLFMFVDKDKSWSERGRGLLRLNDDADGVHSRIVMRSAGIHRVILNTSIWPAMICEKANQKSIRITGTEPESDVVHVYLITGPSNDMDHLHTAVNYRIQRLKQTMSQSSETQSVKRKTGEEDDETSPKKTRIQDDECDTENQQTSQ